MQDELIGYLLQALDDEQAARVDDILQTCAETQRQLKILSRGIQPVNALADDVVIPCGLSIRTCHKVRQLAGSLLPED